ncbi:21148_t:CDS:2, partial [Cetraspora pellucida]
LTAIQKCSLCEQKEQNPHLTNNELAKIYQIGKLTPKLEDALGLWVDNALESNQDIDDDIVKELSEYNIYYTLINATETWSMVLSETIINCWKKTGILLIQEAEMQEINYKYNEEFFRNDDELEILINKLSENNYLSAFEYICIEDTVVVRSLTDNDILEVVADNAKNKVEQLISKIKEKVNYIEAEIAVDTVLRFLYKQEEEFGKVEEKTKILRKLYRKVRLFYIKNLKQLDLHYFISE